MKNANKPRYRSGCLAKFLLLDLLFDKKSRPILIYVGTVILFAAFLYHWLEGWNWLDSFYFVIITMTTIGYGDLTPTTSLTKLLTIFVALNGVAVLFTLLDEIRRVRSDQAAQRLEARSRGPNN